MADRRQLLDRLQIALANPDVDGVLASPDIMDDLLLLGALEGKLLFGSMNRGGLSGLVNEFDDRFTGHTAAALEALGADGGKMLTRICLGDPDTVATLEATAKAIDSLAERKLIAMVEPFLSVRENGKVRNDLSTNAVIKSVAIAEGLGSTSAYTWMKLPVVAEMERVMASTTMPTVLLGGDPDSSQDECSPAGRTPSRCRASRASPWAGPCSTRTTATWPVPWQPPPRCCTTRIHPPRIHPQYRSNVPWEPELPGTRRMTVAQAVVEYLSKQYTVDSIGGQDYRERLIPGTFGIFGHGNVAGVGQALKQYQQLDPAIMPYYQGRNEQAQAHQAVGYARHTRRRQTFAISTSIGPGSSNLLTGAALATTNRLPVLLLPSDTFATRAADPVLQQLEQPYAYDITVNDAFRPLSKFFDRVSRPEQLFSAFHHGLRVLTDPAETGAVTISLPQDVQAEAFDVPEEFLAEREWRIRRPDADDEDIRRAADAIRAAKRPLIIAGGGVLYAYANEELAKFVELTGIPVGNTQAGVGVLPWDHKFSLGAIGSTGTTAANAIAAEADLIIGIGTRYEDFTTASRTAFQNPDVKFININVARSTPTSTAPRCRSWRTPARPREAEPGPGRLPHRRGPRAEDRGREEALGRHGGRGVRYPLHPAAGPERDHRRHPAPWIRRTLSSAPPAPPGDLHKMWRVRDPFGYHVEYAYSCMGYEIPGGLGVKRAALAEAAKGGAQRDVVVMVGDGSYLMMHTELVTAVAERIKLIVVLIQNHGYASIGSLSESLGSQRFGTQYRALDEEHHSFDDGDRLPVDLALNAESLGVKVIRIEPGEKVIAELEQAIQDAKAAPENGGPIVIHVESDPLLDAPSSESWWDVPVSQESELESTKQAFQTYTDHKSRQRKLLG